MSSKRPRSPSACSSPSSSPPPSPTSKLLRTSLESSDVPLACNLPPTCSNKPILLASLHELEAHYAMYHAHVCEEKHCGKVFPDARLLELHFAECHDPITELKKERGEKTFACHLASCPRLFLTPKARRLHLIQAHGYPKEYFFAVTNKGVGGLLKKWGQGASLIRGEWKARVQDQDMESGSDSEMTVEHDSTNGMYQSLHNDDTMLDSPTDDGSHAEPDSLVDAMSSLSLVPSKIRFGRGGKKGGFVHPPSQGKNVRSPPRADGELSTRRRNNRRSGRSKANEGTSSTNGDTDTAAMRNEGRASTFSLN